MVSYTLELRPLLSVRVSEYGKVEEKMNEYAARLEGLKGTHAENMKLMAMNLDERNKLVMGLYSFVERRDDIGPKWESLAQLVTGLADSGGGWVSP